ncbi:hypothetical protein BP6252_10655 [Coleophoma cylindrospora]|uniref:Uncharacterized protein n=1 Tax=Coleophoma cylindrospora TaxID=1849047 RepID=A0A3D8QU11_9HELO|nr:hypothetical protein BP6252_10655 [Coleophoma cylindrospora]
MGVLGKIVKAIEVKQKGEAYSAYPPSRWGNRDIFPIIKAERTYTWYDFYSYWFVAGICLTSWTLGSSLIAIGLTAGQACGAVLVGGCLASLNAFLCGETGRQHYLGYTMMGRATWGLYGSYLCIALSCVQSLIYFGIQSYYGGEAVVIILSSLSHSFMTMKNTLPESAAITTQALIGFLVYIAVFIPIIYVPPHKLNRFLWPVFFLTCVTFAGVLGWAVHANHGPGNLVQPAIAITATQGRYAMVQGICQVAGAYTGGSVRISDWTRFTSTPFAPKPGMATAMPIGMTIGALVGVIVTSATNQMYGILQWNPLLMLQYVQTVQYTPACRAGTFFAGMGFFISQIFVNMTQNCVSSGMDFAGLLPRFISLRRGGLLVAVIGVVIQPWRFLSQASVFLSVIGTFGVFVAPMTGILVTDYWIVRRRKLIIPDLYSEKGIYWYNWGLNWRAFVCFCVAWVPSMPGLISSINGMHISTGLTRMYQITFFFGYIVGGGLYWICCTISPPPGLGIMETMDPGLIEAVGPTDLEVASLDQARLDTNEVGEKKVMGEKVATRP